MSLPTQAIRDLEDLYAQYAEAQTPAEQDAILHTVRDRYGMSQASLLLTSVRKNRGYYQPHTDPTQEDMQLNLSHYA